MSQADNPNSTNPTLLPAAVRGSSISFLVFLREIEAAVGRRLSWAEKDRAADAFLADCELSEAILFIGEHLAPADMPPALQHLLDKRARRHAYQRQYEEERRLGCELRLIRKRRTRLQRLVSIVASWRG